MELLAHAEGRSAGRWIVAPRKGVPFLGRHHRAAVRARERRRRVLVFLLESILLSFLIGLVPPLRVLWLVTAGLGVLLFAYVWLLVAIKARSASAPVREGTDAAREPKHQLHLPEVAAAARYVAEGTRRTARPTFNGLGGFDDEDSVHVVVMPASRRLSAAGA
jgi:hypothetical protein